MKSHFYKQIFHFKVPSGTSRGVLTEKTSWFLQLWDESNPEVIGTGEISIIEGLSPDFIDVVSFENKISAVCLDLENQFTNSEIVSIDSLQLNDFPSIKFGVETALLDLRNGGKQMIFNNEFARGSKKIPINGLIWMGNSDFMHQQIEQKLREGFTTIKMKIGAIDFEKEIEILSSIRNRYSKDQITLRVDANGAFTPLEAQAVLQKLSEIKIHSIEQPIRAGQWLEMKKLCQNSPTPIALDEELIGVTLHSEKINLLDTIRPQFIILKPSLHGGISGTIEWISLADERKIPWWITSALESNIGLNAICQLAGEFDNPLPQGLGTGSLFTNNIESDLVVENGMIYKVQIHNS